MNPRKISLRSMTDSKLSSASFQTSEKIRRKQLITDSVLDGLRRLDDPPFAASGNSFRDDEQVLQKRARNTG